MADRRYALLGHGHTVDKIDAETSTDGYVITSDGAGNAAWEAAPGAGGGASQLSELSDVGVTTPTNTYALMADGDSWESRAIVEADISDLGTYLTSETSHADVVVDGDFTSDGFLKRSGGAGSYTVDTSTYLTSVVAGDVNAEASADGYVLTSDGIGGAAWEAAAGGGSGPPFPTPLLVYTAGNVAVGGSQTAKIGFTRLDATPLADLAFFGAQDLELKNYNHGGKVRVTAEDTSGTEQTLLSMDPDAGFYITSMGTFSVTHWDGASYRASITTTHNGTNGVAMKCQGVTTATVVPGSQGGLKAVNQVTGGSSLQRVLTTADLGGADVSYTSGITATWTTGSTASYASGSTTKYDDNAELTFGTGSDVNIDFDGTNWVVAGAGLASFTGFDGVKTDSYFQLRTETSTNLNNENHAVNTSNGKVEGAMVFNSTTNKPVWAVGPLNGDVWVDATGTTAHTPTV